VVLVGQQEQQLVLVVQQEGAAGRAAVR